MELESGELGLYPHLVALELSGDQPGIRAMPPPLETRPQLLVLSSNHHPTGHSVLLVLIWGPMGGATLAPFPVCLDLGPPRPYPGGASQNLCGEFLGSIGGAQCGAGEVPLGLEPETLQ